MSNIIAKLLRVCAPNQGPYFTTELTAAAKVGVDNIVSSIKATVNDQEPGQIPTVVVFQHQAFFLEQFTFTQQGLRCAQRKLLAFRVPCCVTVNCSTKNAWCRNTTTGGI